MKLNFQGCMIGCNLMGRWVNEWNHNIYHTDHYYQIGDQKKQMFCINWYQWISLLIISA